MADVALTVGGQLDPASDSGISNSDAITNVTQPHFFGTTSEPDAKVFVYATANRRRYPRPSWARPSPTATAPGASPPASALADGSYTITAQAIDNSNHTISPVATVTQTLVIDTVGPKVTDLFFDRINGQVLATFHGLRRRGQRRRRPQPAHPDRRQQLSPSA